jgi:AraC family transcriptional regulator
MKETSSELSADVTVREMPERTVAYIRHVGPYAGDADLFAGLFGRLFRWAEPRGLFRPGETEVMSVYHDDPAITEEQKLRVSACLTVPPDTEVEGEVGKMTIAGGRYATARFELKPQDYGAAWQAVYGGWLPESGYQPDDRPAFELYHGQPGPDGRNTVDICVPVKPL